MKKILKALFSLLVVLGLVSVSVACNKKTEEPKEETPAVTEGEKTPEATPTKPETPEHTHAYGDWKFDETDHWKECSCGEISEKAAHAGGEATYTEKAVCTTCGQEYGDLKPVPDPIYSYHVVGGLFNDWNDYTYDNQMAEISVDELDESIASQLLDKEINGVYVYEGREFRAGAGWETDAYISGPTSTKLDGGYTIKVVNACYDFADDVTSAAMWCPDPHKAKVQNLTPDTLYMPKWVETPAEGEEHLGKWNDNPVVIGGAGLYTIYFVEYAGANSADSPKYAMAVVKTDAEAASLLTVAEGDKANYTLSAEAGVTTIAVDKQAGSEWSSVMATIPAFPNARSVRFTLSGSGIVLLKLEGSGKTAEVKLELGETKAWQWNLTGENEQAILSGEFKFVLFAFPGEASGKGTINIENFYFSVDKAKVNPIESGFTNIKPVECPETPEGMEEFEYDGTSATFNINRNWDSLDKDPDLYTFEEVENGVKVSYNTSNWQFGRTTFWGDYRKFTHVTIKVTGVAGEKLLLKAEGNGRSFGVEDRFEFNGSEQTFSISLEKVKESVRAAGYCVLICGNDGQGGNSSFVIHELYLGNSDETNLGEAAPKPEEPTFVRPNAEIYWTGDTFSALNGTWYGGGQPWADWYSEGPDKFTWDAATKTMSFADRSGDYSWSVFGTNVKGNFANFSTLTYKFTATEGLKIKFVVMCQTGGNKEIKEVVATGAEQEVVLDLSGLTADERSTIQRIGFYAGYQAQEWDDPRIQSGQVQLHAVDFGGYASTTTTGADTFECKYFFDIANPTPVYTISRVDGKTVVDFNKQPGSEWNCMLTFLDGNLEGYTKLNYDVELSEGAFLTIKIEGTIHLELKLDGDATIKTTGAGTIDLTELAEKYPNIMDALAGAQKVAIFVNLGQVNCKGKVTINSLTFTK